MISASYTYSHSIDDSSDWQDQNFVNSFDPRANRASSNFDERHILTFSYVYSLPSFGLEGWKKVAFAGWQYSGITSFNTGQPFSVLNGIFADNAGVANGVGTNGSYADVVGNPYSKPSGCRDCRARSGFRSTALQSCGFRSADRPDLRNCNAEHLE